MLDHIAKDPVTEKSAVKPGLGNATHFSCLLQQLILLTQTVSILSLSNLFPDTLFKNVFTMEEKPVRSQVIIAEKDCRNIFFTFN